MKKIILILAILLITLLINFGDLKCKDLDLSPEKKLELASKCSKDGKEFYENYKTKPKYYGMRIAWEEPEYHYSRTLNTCLIYISYRTYVGDSILIPDSILYDKAAIDIYANKEIIGSHYFKKQGKSEFEKQFLFDEDVKDNLHPDEFTKKKNILFSE